MVAAAAASEPARRALKGVAVAGVTATVLLAAQAQGAHDVHGYGPLGLVLVAAAILSLAAGLRPSRRAAQAAGAVGALAAWTLLSAAWGGVPSEAVADLDRLLVAAAALLVGSMLGSDGRARMIIGGVALGITLLAVEVLAVLPFHPAHGGWLEGAVLIGPVGYKNAQGGLFALAIPILLSLLPDARRALRPAIAAGAVVLLAGLLLTESRGALLALTLAVAVQLVIDRRGELRLAVAVLCACAAALFVTLTEIYTRIEDPARVKDAVTLYALLTVGLAFLAALAAVRIPPEIRLSRSVVAIVALVAVGSAVAVGIKASPLATSSGATAGPRLTDITFSGRLDAWRAAWTMTQSAPIEGHGVGSFARRWPVLKPPQAGHILQPHSIEFEELAELGLVGLVLFGGLWVLVLRAPDRRDAPLAAAAVAVGIVLLGQASVDWTWSFPGLVAPAFLVVGVAAGGGAGHRRVPLLREISVALAALAALVVIGGPYLAHRDVEAATGAQGANPTHALSRAHSATRLNPWDADAYTLQAQILEAHGDDAAAAAKYADAARRSLEPYVGLLEEARAAGKAGEHARAIGACRAAILANPYVADDVLAFCPRADGRVWPLAARPAAKPYTQLLVSARCSGCDVSAAGRAIAASVPGGFPFRDSAFALVDLGAAGLRDTIVVSADLAISRVPDGDLTLVDVRDTRGRLVYSLYVVGHSRKLFLYNPPGGIRSDSFVLDLHAMVPLAPERIPISVALVRGSSIEIRTRGRLLTRMPGPGYASPTGATTGRYRFVEAGILAYESNRLHDRMDARITGLAAHA